VTVFATVRFSRQNLVTGVPERKVFGII